MRCAIRRPPYTVALDILVCSYNTQEVLKDIFFFFLLIDGTFTPKALEHGVAFRTFKVHIVPIETPNTVFLGLLQQEE